MKIQHLLLTICLMLSICSCELPAIDKATDDPATSLLLTGESLSSTKLSYIEPTDDDQVLFDRFTFSFTLTFSNDVKVKKDNGAQFNVVPSGELFSSFGSNKKAIMDEFDRIHQEVCDNYLSVYRGAGRYSFDVMTILYNGGISLTCESEFAGHAAGENLASVITCFPRYDYLVKQSGENPIIAGGFNTPSNVGKNIEMPMEYISMLGSAVKFSIPKGNYELVHTGANFRLEIPVRVVNYLTWLNDKISNPDAEIPYRDEVLTCSFRTNWTLR